MGFLLEEQYDESYLNSLIKGKIEESLTLEYKRSYSLENNEHNKSEISKDVSAFANSDGGKIIYGIIEDNHIPVGIDGWAPVEGKKEWLDQVINSRIQPRIFGVEIYPIRLESKPEKAVFVVEIPKGITAHQASDCKYYRRFNFESVPMYDYEVKMTINRAREPILNIELVKNTFSYEDQSWMLLLKLTNSGKISAKEVEVFLVLPEEFEWETRGDWERIRYQIPQQEKYYDTYKLSLKEPIHPGKQILISRVSDLGLVMNPQERLSRFDPPYQRKGRFEIYAENMQPRSGKLNFTISYRDIKLDLTTYENI
jgi:hypothetical protein